MGTDPVQGGAPPGAGRGAAVHGRSAFTALAMSVVFFFFARPDAVLEECRRVLRPKGQARRPHDVSRAPGDARRARTGGQPRPLLHGRGAPGPRHAGASRRRRGGARARRPAAHGRPRLTRTGSTSASPLATVRTTREGGVAVEESASPNAEE